MDRGFDEFFGFTDAVHAWQKFPTQLWDGREFKASEGYADSLVTDHAIDFIKQHKADPFFLYVPFICPHGLPDAPKEDIELFKGKFHEQDPEHPWNAIYAAEVFHMDKDIGRILKTLDELQINDNTIVIFTSDQGAEFMHLARAASLYFDSNRPFRGDKRTLWEGGIACRAWCDGPAWMCRRMAIRNEIIHDCDLFPTLFLRWSRALKLIRS